MDSLEGQENLRTQLTSAVGRIGNLGPIVEAATKISLGLTAILYVVGLIVSNLYLITIGVTDFSLLKARCIFTGAWCVVLFAACFLSGYVGARTFHKYVWDVSSWRSRLAGLILVFSIELTFYFTLKELFSHLVGPDTGHHILWDFFYFCCPFGVGFGIMKMRKTASLTPFDAVYLLMLLAPIGYCSVLYPHVHQEYGGGEPLKVTLVLSREGTEAWRSLKPQVDGQTGTSLLERIELLYQNESIAVIRDKTGSTFILDRRLVSIISPQPSQKAGLGGR